MRRLRKGVKVEGMDGGEWLELLKELRELVASRSGNVARADGLISQLTGGDPVGDDDASDTD